MLLTSCVVEITGVQAFTVIALCVLPQLSVEEQAEKVGDTGREFSQTSVISNGHGPMGHAPFSEAISQWGYIDEFLFVRVLPQRRSLYFRTMYQHVACIGFLSLLTPPREN